MLSNIWRIKNLRFLNCTIKQFQTLVHITADGIYGSITDLALINYIKIIQEKLGANQDGLAGDQTKQKCVEFQKKNRTCSRWYLWNKNKGKIISNK